MTCIKDEACGLGGGYWRSEAFIRLVKTLLNVPAGPSCCGTDINELLKGFKDMWRQGFEAFTVTIYNHKTSVWEQLCNSSSLSLCALLYLCVSFPSLASSAEFLSINNTKGSGQVSCPSTSEWLLSVEQVEDDCNWRLVSMLLDGFKAVPYLHWHRQLEVICRLQHVNCVNTNGQM